MPQTGGETPGRLRPPEDLAPQDRETYEREFRRRRKSQKVAFFLWFFLGVVAAHKIYLGKLREALFLITLYLVVPLAAVTAVLVGMVLLGFELPQTDISAAETRALLRETWFLALAGVALAALTAVWIWDYIVLRRQVREANARIAEEIHTALGRRSEGDAPPV